MSSPWTRRRRFAGLVLGAGLIGAAPPPSEDPAPPPKRPLPKKLELDAETLRRLQPARPAPIVAPKGRSTTPGTEQQRQVTRAARARVERTRAAAQAQAVLKGRPLPPAYRLASERHARRIAEIDRVLFIARQQQDEEAIRRATALFQRERARHAAWIRRFGERLRRPAEPGEASR